MTDLLRRYFQVLYNKIVKSTKEFQEVETIISSYLFSLMFTVYKLECLRYLKVLKSTLGTQVHTSI